MSVEKGIVLAGGSGTRLRPLTQAVSKQLLPIYDKPVINYPIGTLMSMGIRDILIISTPRDINPIKSLFLDGNDYGLNISYAVQDKPNGIAESLIIGEEHIGDHRVCLVLGDNFFHSDALNYELSEDEVENAFIYGLHVNNPSDYGVIELERDTQKVKSIEEKPTFPKTNYIATGLYRYPKNVSKIARELVPSERGELEITDLNQWYLKNDRLSCIKLTRGTNWFDVGSFDNLLSASLFVKNIQETQGLKISCLEELAIRKGFISKNEFKKLVKKFGNTPYAEYLKNIQNEI